MVLSVNSRVPGTGQSKALVPITSATQIAMEASIPREPSSTMNTARRRTFALSHRMPRDALKSKLGPRLRGDDPFSALLLLGQQLPPARRDLLRHRRVLGGGGG